MQLLLQIAALLCALLVVAKGVSLLRTPARRRIGAVFVTMGALFTVVCGLFVFLGVRGSALASAPGYGIHSAGGVPLFREATPGIWGAASYERELYGTAYSAQAVASALFVELAPLGYARALPTSGPSFRAGEPAPVAQFQLKQWRWRVYELAMPTRFAGAYYDGRAFAHLVAVVLSDDGG